MNRVLTNIYEFGKALLFFLVTAATFFAAIGLILTDHWVLALVFAAVFVKCLMIGVRKNCGPIV